MTMGARFLILAAGALLGALAGFTTVAGEAELISVLESPQGAAECCEACRQLLAEGTATCVPALAKALADERAGHAALHTLERLPFPEAGAALREAIGSLTGPLRVGVVDAAGWKKDAAAVDCLTPLLGDPDDAVAGAAAVALGRIGGPAAEAALSKSIRQARAGVRASMCEGLLRCAEAHMDSGNLATAASLYGRIRSSEVPEPCRSAALRGLLLSDGERRQQLFVEAITGANPADREVALAFLPELGDPGTLAPLLEHWVALPPVAQTALLEVHPLLGGKAVPVVLAAAAGGEEEVRQTALRVMGEMRDPALIPVLAKAASAGSKRDQLVARNSLASIHGPGVSEAIHDFLKSARGQDRVEVLRILGRRGSAGDAEVLLRFAGGAGDEDAKQAARQALHFLAAPETLSRVVELALASTPESEARQFERIVTEVCQTAEAGNTGGPERVAALEVLLLQFGDPKKAASAALLSLAIAESLAGSHPALASNVARQVVERTADLELAGRARALLDKVERAAR